MILPEGVLWILNRLGAYETYLVGGCVRDALRGEEVHDYDFCTSAKPDELLRVFSDCRTLTVGLQHGTVGVVREGKKYEITTFRSDGKYEDNRHPESVSFTSSIAQDLARRDFTVNAMAYHPSCGYIDPYGGREDLKKGILRAVGDPDLRFREDALRILRGVRFASVCGFSVEKNTEAAMLRQRGLIAHVSSERKYTELCGFLMGKHVTEAGLTHAQIIFAALPALAPMYRFEQHSKYHVYDVWEHTMRAVGAGNQLPVRLALLFHDSGKPACYTSENGVGHFYGHAKISAKIARETLTDLKADKATAERVESLVALHDHPVDGADEKRVKRLLSKIGEEAFLQLLEVKRGDAIAHAPFACEGRLREIEGCLSLYRTIKEQEQCFTLKQLAVNGNDLLALGLRGRQVGLVLRKLLSLVMEGNLKNERGELCDFVRKNKENFEGNID